MDIPEAAQGQVAQDFTAKTASTYAQDLAIIPQKVFDLNPMRCDEYNRSREL
jgi:hypothetical protein